MPTFYDLPFEIREMIYREALVKNVIYIRPFVSMKYMEPELVKKYNRPNMKLLLASKQIYEEAIPIFLRENTFSIVQVDLLAAARLENPRLFEQLKMIRHLEIVFDTRDYIYMVNIMSGHVPVAVTAVDKAVKNGTEGKERLISSLKELHNRVKVHVPQKQHLSVHNVEEVLKDEGHVKGEGPVKEEHKCDSGCDFCEHEAGDVDFEVYEDEYGVYAPDDEEGLIQYYHHEVHLDNMKEYLWGRTLTFVRQTFDLESLTLDLHYAYCFYECCRLAAEVMELGDCKTWLHGVPRSVYIFGTTDREDKAIFKILDRQHEASLLPLVDEEKEKQAQAKRYNALFKQAYETALQRIKAMRGIGQAQANVIAANVVEVNEESGEHVIKAKADEEKGEDVSKAGVN